jgi:ssDNA-binding Zn-finger/Zn-ribbon topoisomerase 1
MGRLRSFVNCIFAFLIASLGLPFVILLAIVASQRAAHADRILFGSAVFGIIFLLVVGVIATPHITRMLKKRSPCAHGVRRGKEGGCQNCIEEEKQRRADLEARKAQLVREREIKDRADTLRASELNKLRKMWLSRSETYFEMEPKQFENAIAALFRNLGFEVKQTPFSNDRGKDAVAWKDGKKYLIECKRYDAQSTIGRRELQIFVAAMKEENAERGFYVNTGRFANTAHKYAAQENIELYDKANFPELVNRAYPVREDALNALVMCLECGDTRMLPVNDATTSGTCPSGHPIANDITREVIRRSSFAINTKCELCGARLRLVGSKHRQFWGCSKYPNCKFTKPWTPR